MQFCKLMIRTNVLGFKTFTSFRSGGPTHKGRKEPGKSTKAKSLIQLAKKKRSKNTEVKFMRMKQTRFR